MGRGNKEIRLAGKTFTNIPKDERNTRITAERLRIKRKLRSNKTIDEGDTRELSPGTLDDQIKATAKAHKRRKKDKRLADLVAEEKRRRRKGLVPINK